MKEVKESESVPPKIPLNEITPDKAASHIEEEEKRVEPLNDDNQVP